MIAIKGMEIPKSCSECKLCVEDKYADMTCVLLCEEWEETDYNENHRDERCPLVEIVNCKECANYDKGGALCSNINCIEYRLVLERQKAKGERKKVR